MITEGFTGSVRDVDVLTGPDGATDWQLITDYVDGVIVDQYLSRAVAS